MRMHAYSQAMSSWSGAVLSMNQDHLWNAIRIAGCSDDRGAARVLRYRIVRVNPVVETVDCLGALVEPHGKTVDECAQATIRAIEDSCVVKTDAMLTVWSAKTIMHS